MTLMNTHSLFPAQALSETTGEPAITLEGQKVVFDKKVSLLPVDVRKEKPVNAKKENGRAVNHIA